jgi:hypothetical protein
MGILNDHQPAWGEMHVVNPDGRLHLNGLEDSSISWDTQELNPRDHGSGAPFEVHSVGPGLDDHFISRLGVGFDGQLIGHRPRGYEEGGLLAQEPRGFFLKGIDSRVFPKDIISHRCRKHGLAHIGSWFRYRVTTKVNKSIHTHFLL